MNKTPMVPIVGAQLIDELRWLRHLAETRPNEKSGGRTWAQKLATWKERYSWQYAFIVVGGSGCVFLKRKERVCMGYRQVFGGPSVKCNRRSVIADPNTHEGLCGRHMPGKR